MLNNQEVCNFLNNALNSVLNTESYKFNIYSEMGDSKDDKSIQGVLTCQAPQLMPVKDVVVGHYVYNIELSVPSSKTNKNLIIVEKQLNEVAKKWNGAEVDFEQGKGTLQFTLTNTGSFDTKSLVGGFIPLKFTLSVTYTEDVVTSVSKHWLLDGVEIPYLSEDVMLEKDGITKSVQGKNYKETLLVGQTKFYHFRIPYKKGVATTLQKDILKGDLEKTYQLEFYDGVSFTKDDPFKARVSIYRNANTGSQKPKESVFDIIFSDVDDGESTTYYELGLFDDEFDAQNENTRWFPSQATQQTYYDKKINNGAVYERIPTPNLDTLTLTNQIYRNNSGYELFNLTNKNKAVIRVVSEEGNKYFYYDVLNATIGANNQVIYDLQLDSLQTYYFNENIVFDGTMVQSAHLNRWVKNDDGSFSFNGKITSDLFEREKIKSVAQRLVGREKMRIVSENTANNELVDWINENVMCWCYLGVNASKIDDNSQTVEVLKYNVLDSSGTSKEISLEATSIKTNSQWANGETIFYPNATLCFPVLKDKTIFINKTYTDEDEVKTSGMSMVDSWGYLGFLDLNKQASYIYSVKLSIKPPFDLKNKTGIYSTNSSSFGVLDFNGGYENEDIISTDFGFNVIRTFKDSNGVFHGLIYINEDYTSPVKLKTYGINLPKTTFGQNEIANVNKNEKLNPKLNSEDYKSLRLTIAGSMQDFPIQKLNTESPVFDYIEMLTLDASKMLIRPYSDDDELVYNTAYSTSFNGFIVSSDNSLPIANTQLANYLANNKNAYVSFKNQQELTDNIAQLNYDTTIKNANISAITSVVTGVISAKAEGGAKGAAQGLGSIIDATSSRLQTENTANAAIKINNMQLAYNQTQFDLTIDNMRNAPATLQNANGSAIFTMGVDDFGVYAELYEGLPKELKVVDDLMFRDGYTYNQLSNLKNFDKIRARFNYVKAVIGTITGVPLSNTARNDIRNRFISGVRFWNAKDDGEFVVDYTKENYEQWINTNYSSFEDWLENQ